MRLRIVLALLWLPLMTTATPARVADQARMWDVVRAPGWDLTVRSVERRIEPLATPEGELLRPGGHFAIFAVDLTNRTDRPLTPVPNDFVLRSADGARFVNLAAAPAPRTYATTAGRIPFGDIVPPGVTVTTIVVFDIDANAGRLTLDFVPAGATIQIDECKCDLPSPVREIERG